MGLIYRLLKLCGCYTWPGRFMKEYKEEMFQNICIGTYYKCEVCGRVIYRETKHGEMPKEYN